MRKNKLKTPLPKPSFLLSLNFTPGSSTFLPLSLMVQIGQGVGSCHLSIAVPPTLLSPHAFTSVWDPPLSAAWRSVLMSSWTAGKQPALPWWSSKPAGPISTLAFGAPLPTPPLIYMFCRVVFLSLSSEVLPAWLMVSSYPVVDIVQLARTECICSAWPLASYTDHPCRPRCHQLAV